jgi:hypothetical protein
VYAYARIGSRRFEFGLGVRSGAQSTEIGRTIQSRLNQLSRESSTPETLRPFRNVFVGHSGVENCLVDNFVDIEPILKQPVAAGRLMIEEDKSHFSLGPESVTLDEKSLRDACASRIKQVYLIEGICNSLFLQVLNSANETGEVPVSATGLEQRFQQQLHCSLKFDCCLLRRIGSPHQVGLAMKRPTLAVDLLSQFVMSQAASRDFDWAVEDEIFERIIPPARMYKAVFVPFEDFQEVRARRDPIYE